MIRLGVIYKVTIGPNFIIGSTLNIKKREQEYRYKLERGEWNNTYVQNSWNKYGSGCFKFEIIKTNVPEDSLEFIEDVFIAICKSRVEYRRGGMNLRGASRVKFTKEIREKMSNSNKGRVASDETKHKMSNTHKNIVHSKEWNKNVSIAKKGKKLSKNCYDAIAVPVYQYSLEGEFIKEWKSMIDASLFYAGKSSANIIGCCKETQKTAYGFQWKYSKYDKINPVSKFDSLKKKVVQKDLCGNIIKIWSSTTEPETSGFSQGRVWECCVGNISAYKGFKWEYLNKSKD